ncbi:MAG: nuclear transport factor 2 family protein [Sphingobium sp.]
MTEALAQLADRIAIQDLICAVTLAGDRRDFDAVFSHFTQDAEFDYSSLFGTPGAVRLPEFRANGARFRPAIDTLHQVTNFQISIDGDEATCVSAVRAMTKVDDMLAENGGLYTHRLVRTAQGWRISHVRYDVIFRQGADLFEAARAKMERMAKEAAAA